MKLNGQEGKLAIVVGSPCSENNGKVVRLGKMLPQSESGFSAVHLEKGSLFFFHEGVVWECDSPISWVSLDGSHVVQAQVVSDKYVRLIDPDETEDESQQAMKGLTETDPSVIHVRVKISPWKITSV